MKATPKSCSCRSCRASKGAKNVQFFMKKEERRFRHRSKIVLNCGGEIVAAAHHGDRAG